MKNVDFHDELENNPRKMSRRDFLRLLAIVTAAGVVKACGAPMPPPSTTPDQVPGSATSTAEALSIDDQLIEMVARKAGVDPGMLKRLSEVKADDEFAKMIKVSMIPGRDVFENEFGREQIQDIIIDPVLGESICSILEDLASFIVIEGFYDQCPKLQSCKRNACWGQNCPNLDSCDKNACPFQTRQFDCTSFDDFTSETVLLGISNDPFIKALYQELNLTQANELAAELNRMLLAERLTLQDIEPEHNLSQYENLPALTEPIQVLKAILIPTTEVFVNEFGREPWKEDVFYDDSNGWFESTGHWDMFGKIDFKDFGTCGGNSCPQQTCNTLTSCTDQFCPDQECPNFTKCGKNVLTIADSLTEAADQPFVQALFKEFQTQDPQVLARELEQLLEKREAFVNPPVVTVQVAAQSDICHMYMPK